MRKLLGKSSFLVVVVVLPFFGCFGGEGEDVETCGYGWKLSILNSSPSLSEKLPKGTRFHHNGIIKMIIYILYIQFPKWFWNVKVILGCECSHAVPIYTKHVCKMTHPNVACRYAKKKTCTPNSDGIIMEWHIFGLFLWG